jgi:hypothetical protein
MKEPRTWTDSLEKGPTVYRIKKLKKQQTFNT